LGASAGNLILEGGAARVVFQLRIEMQRLEATFYYEDPAAAPLGSLSVSDYRFLLNVHPATLHLTSRCVCASMCTSRQLI
jgi:hypothetical protein